MACLIARIEIASSAGIGKTTRFARQTLSLCQTTAPGQSPHAGAFRKRPGASSQAKGRLTFGRVLTFAMTQYSDQALQYCHARRYFVATPSQFLLGSAMVTAGEAP